MTAPQDLRRLKDAGLRELLALVISATEEVECPNCHASVRVKGSADATTTCPSCGGSLTAEVSSLSTAQLPTKQEPPTPAVPKRRKVEIPKRIGKYEIRKLLDKGGFGRVLLAYDTEAKREVALKTPRLEKFGDDPASLAAKRRYVDAFLAEGRRMALLKHQHIVDVYDVGEDSQTDWAYIAMELAEGGTLHERMQCEPKLTRAESARIVAEAAEAVHHAHTRQIYHCDLKPTNILLTKRGRVKVTDFGLAIHEDEQLQAEGQFAGTLPYMSPEQIDGGRHQLDGRTDVWSLGVILYELLAGRRPFEGVDNRQLKAAILTKPVRPLAQRSDDFPSEYDRIVATCLEKPPKLRYDTAIDLCKQLREGLRREFWRRCRTPALMLTGFVAICFAAMLSLSALQSPGVPKAFPFQIDDAAAPGKNFSLLEHRALPFSVQDPQAIPPSWFQDTNAGWITMNSSAYEILDVGQTSSSQFSVTLDMKRTDWVGEAGVCLGISPQQSPNGELSATFQGIWVVGDFTTDRRLERKIISATMNPVNDTYEIDSRVTIAVAEIDQPVVDEAQRLDVEVFDDNVIGIRWNGRKVPELVAPQMQSPRTLPSTKGAIGLASFRGATEYRNVTVLLPPKEKR